MMNPFYLVDAYKTGHHLQYPKGTELIFSNFTPRKSKMKNVDYSVWFGLKYFLEKYLDDTFDGYFFSYPNDNVVVKNYQNMMLKTMGIDTDAVHIKALYKLGYLPIAIYALPEGSVVPCGVPALVMFNTHPDFFWLPNMLETIMSCILWQPCTSATIAREFRLLLDKYAAETSDQPEFVDYQAHDFSMRGMSSLESAMTSGIGHLLYFKGTDSIPAMMMAYKYYDKELQLCSVPATEHSVASSYGHEERRYFQKMLSIYPTGIISIVADTYNLWNFIYGLEFDKELIMQRDGKVVIRPDSGDPLLIICGTGNPSDPPSIQKGVIELLWDIFGGTINSKGYKQLDNHIGAIYGDSITLDRARDICERLKQKGFSSTNMVFGIGSYTYQYNTRDTLGWAMKSTYAEINGIGRAITKDPITDDGTKKSHSGILKVIKLNGAHGSTYQVLQNQTWDQFHMEDNELKLVFKDGKLYV
jgi:nicotinamide phosphoribosyltransferase